MDLAVKIQHHEKFPHELYFNVSISQSTVLIHSRGFVIIQQNFDFR